MSMKPILFNTEMVRAILDGCKTAMRRVVKPQPFSVPDTAEKGVKPPYHPGDTLYVREKWCSAYDGEKYFYFADKCTQREENRLLNYDDVCWRPSIHMPREAARIFLRVTDVRVERLQDIDNAGARAEGCDGRCSEPQDGDSSDWQKEYDFSVEKFMATWDRTIKPQDRDLYGWDANPWVWVIEFERCEKPEAAS